MHCFMISIVALLMKSHGLVAQTIHNTAAEYQNTLRSIQDDLKLHNSSCSSYDSCAEQRITNSTAPYTCHCGPKCVRLDTCCLDSPYIALPKPKVRPNCRSAYNGETFFMVDRCPSGDSSAFEGLCRNEWDGEDDTLRIVPVTSLQTSITYKNYFCFKCHEKHEDFVRWNVRLRSNVVNSNNSAFNKHVSLKYDRFEATWIAVIDNFSGGSFPVNISVIVPFSILSYVDSCNKDVISSCWEHWTDEEVERKCKAYTAMKKTFRDGLTVTYRNMHCAVCNFEIFDDRFFCGLYQPSQFSGGAHDYGYSAINKFTYRDLLEILNTRKSAKITKCDDGSMFDPYGDKCSQLVCVVPGTILRRGKCVNVDD